MNSCHELAPLIAAHASGGLAAGERERLEAHLEGCADCRGELASLTEALSLASLPAASELELHALSALPGQARAAWGAQERTRRRDVRIFGVGLAAVAAAVLLALTPGLRSHAPNLASAAPTPDDDTELAVASLSDGPVEVSDDADDSSPSDDPEANPTADLDEGDE